MKIIIKKKINSKHTITYIREGFSDYWYEADNFLVLHDLCHYAIEYTLEYKTAFWGLVASGINPNVFENKVKRDALELSNEAWHSEHLANLLLIEFTQGLFDDINKMLEQSLLQQNSSIPFIKISSTKLTEIRTLLYKLIDDWKAVKDGDYLSLNFTISA
ncbi:MAG: hypothetical protein RL372_82 [Bacteroidota bacterium]|jgi:hypothetical protein